MLVHTISFKVKGVTFKNEKGKNIQKEIKDILKEYKSNDYFDSLYGGYTNNEIKEMDLDVSEYEGYSFPAKLVGDEYKGEDCIKIYFKTYNDDYIHVGYAPKDNLNEISEWMTKEGIKTEGRLEVTGGRYKHLEIIEEDYEEKERIATEELTYGLKITLNFYDDKKDSDYFKKQEEIKRDINREKAIPYIITGIVCVLFIWILYKIFSFFIWLFN